MLTEYGENRWTPSAGRRYMKAAAAPTRRTPTIQTASRVVHRPLGDADDCQDDGVRLDAAGDARQAGCGRAPARLPRDPHRFSREGAAEQAARCEQCGIPFCQIHCPLHNNIPDWLRMTAEDRLEEAYELASATNNMPEICGRICPQDRLCEGNCVIEKGFESVTIGAVEKHITDTAFERGWVKPPTPTARAPESIGVIGAGPAGLAVADQLRKRGYQIDVYDRYDRVGGLLIYGIPNFKLEKAVVERRADMLAAGGIRFHLDCEVGSEPALRRAAGAPRRAVRRHRRLPGARHRHARRRPRQHRAGARLS